MSSWIDQFIEHQKTWPVAKVAGLVVARDKTAAQWPASLTDYPPQAVTAITESVDNAFDQMQEEITKFANEGFLITASLQARLNLARQEYAAVVSRCSPAGQNLRCPQLRGATLNIFNQIIGWYNKLGESAARARVDEGIIDFVAKVFYKIGDIAQQVWEGIKSGFEAVAKGADWALQAVKWGSIAGGLWLLYEYVLKPKKS